MASEVTDDPSQTIMFVENVGESIHWMEPSDLRYETMSLRLNDPRGVSSKYLAPAVVMLDGSLRKLRDPLPADVLRVDQQLPTLVRVLQPLTPIDG